MPEPGLFAAGVGLTPAEERIWLVTFVPEPGEFKFTLCLPDGPGLSLVERTG